MFCHKCGEKLIKDSLFCSKCGAAVHILEENLEPAISNTQPNISPSLQSSVNVLDWAVLGAPIGRFNMLSALPIYYRNENDVVKFDWGKYDKDGSVDMLITEGSLLFSPSQNKSSLQKTGLNISKHGSLVGMYLGTSAGPIGMAVGAAIGTGIAALAGAASTSSSDLEDFKGRYLLGQGIFCLRKDIKVKVYAVKKSFFTATNYYTFVEGSLNFSGVEIRDVAIMLSGGEISDPRKSLISSGYTSEVDQIKCSELDYVQQMREKYPYSYFGKLMTFEERLEYFEELQKEMELERKAEKNKKQIR